MSDSKRRQVSHRKFATGSNSKQEPRRCPGIAQVPALAEQVRMTRKCVPEQILTHPTRIQIREYALPSADSHSLREWADGTRPTKKAFFRRISDDLHAKARVRKEDVWIVLIDADRTDWTFGNGEMQYEPKLASIARNQSLCLCPCPCGNVGASVGTEFAAGHLAFRIR